ncbi:hypothetical protein ACFYVR_05355 [Rhodococcus sp. NPDC003318]|uniref:hypothetical protein n=1 Tax=Rhodococcus sp. NPDC003318 TaxID=3364503 RepID=UPI0036738E5C
MTGSTNPAGAFRRRRLMPSIPMQRRIAAVSGAIGALCVVSAFLVWRWDDLQPAQGTVLGGVGVLAAALVAYYGVHRTRISNEKIAADQLRQARDQLAAENRKLQGTLDRQQQALDQTHRRETVRDLRARFTSAAAQLADPSGTVRLAGVYAMASLADDWHNSDTPNDRERQVCIDVLCGYLRLPYNSLTADEGERQVRRTVVGVIREHLQKDAPSSWQCCHFDFSETDFRGAEMDFLGARFSGRVDFSGTVFESGEVSFRGSVFSGATVDFSRATFVDGEVSFWSATFESSWISFSGAGFRGGMVDFSETILDSDVNFFGAEVYSGGRIDFSGAVFRGGNVDFSETAFLRGGEVDFSESVFCGADVDFSGAVFKGGDVDFTSPGAWNEGPTVPWEDTPPIGVTPGRWPPEVVRVEPAAKETGGEFR